VRGRNEPIMLLKAMALIKMRHIFTMIS
jgi:hypothetical protein